MATMTLSSKGQVTLPTKLRKALGLRAGDQIAITHLGSRAILTKERVGDITTLAARLGKKPGRALSKPEQQAIVSKAAYDEYVKKVRSGRA